MRPCGFHVDTKRAPPARACCSTTVRAPAVAGAPSRERLHVQDCLELQNAPTCTIAGVATAKGALKQSSQDFFVTLSEPPLHLSGSLPGPASDVPPLRAWRRASPQACSGGPSSPSHCQVDLPPGSVVAGVYDGHGGEKSALAAAQSLIPRLLRSGVLAALGHGDAEATSRLCGAAYHSLDDEILAESAAAEGAGDGSTALVALLAGAHLAVANAGDCRAVLCRGGRAERLSRDHTPADKDERARIERVGGRVALARGAVRILVPGDGVVRAMSVSRGLGDADFKAAALVIATPDVRCTQLQAGRDEFLILGSDGLWTFVPDQVAVDAVAAVLREFAHMRTVGDNLHVAATAAAQRLVRLAQDRGSLDDITVLVHVYQWGQVEQHDTDGPASVSKPTALAYSHALAHTQQ